MLVSSTVMSGSGSLIWNNTSNVTEGASECYSVLHIAASQAAEVGRRLLNDSYTNDNISLAVKDLDGGNESLAYIFPKVELNTGDTRSERLHFYNSAALLLIMCLLFLTVITIWVFKVRRFRVLHETGLSMIYGGLNIAAALTILLATEQYAPISGMPYLASSPGPTQLRARGTE